jgi:hypothetical protein
MLKNASCLWDMSLQPKRHGRRGEGTAIDFAECGRTLKMKGREPLTSPEQVAAELREGVAAGSLVFTASADLDVVIDLYEKAFVHAFNTFLQARHSSHLFLAARPDRRSSRACPSPRSPWAAAPRRRRRW